MVTTVWHSPSVNACVSPTACWRGPSGNLGPLYADWLEKVSTKFSCHEIQFHGKCFWHHKPVPSSEQAKKKYSFWSTGGSLIPFLLQRADPIIPIILHPPNLCVLIWPKNALYATSRQLQVLACNHISVWALGLRIPTMKVSSASKSENYVQTGSKTFSRCLHATALTKSLIGPKWNIPSLSENRTRSSGSHAPIEVFSLNSTDTAQSLH